MPDSSLNTELDRELAALGARARTAQAALAAASADDRTRAIKAAAASLRAASAAIAKANERDIARLPADATPAFRDRLALDAERISAIASGMEAIAAQADPVGTELARWERPNGLDIARIAVPIGVIGVIFESRPNVAADAAALCLRAGDAVILRGGSEAAQSCAAIVDAVRGGLVEAGLPADIVQIIPTQDRAAVGAILQGLDGAIDLVIPRGGKSLVARVQSDARVPVLAHLDGLCHTYIHASADPDKARRIIADAKMRRPGICGATETLLIDTNAAPALLPAIASDLGKLGCALRGDERARAIVPDIAPATDEDFATEHLDAILNIAVVNGVDAALAHIDRFGSDHTDAIVAEDAGAIAQFLNKVDSAIVIANASTQFADGGEFGFGAEIGIATGRLHARGPVGAEQLTTYKYILRGNGQIRG